MLAWRCLAALVVAAIALVGAAPSASAHAVVLSSSPSADERLPQAPTSVSIHFSEPVSIKLGGLRVLDATGRRVDNGDNHQPQSDTLESTLKAGLPAGTYVANYQIVSADGHPIRGSIVFGVGDAALGDVSGLRSTTNSSLDAANKLGQFVTYLGIMVAAGLAFFMAFVLDDTGADRRGLARLTRGAGALGGVGMALTVVTQAALETGGGLGAIFDRTVSRSLLSQGLGWQSLAQVVGLVACLASLSASRAVRSQLLALYGGVAATGSFVLFGHATQSAHPILTVPADIVHVAVGAVWFGGLVGLATVVRARSRRADAPNRSIGASSGSEGLGSNPMSAMDAGSGRIALLERTEAGDGPGSSRGAADGEDDRFTPTLEVVSRFSSMAFISVAMLVVAGLTLGVVEVGSVARLLSTRYGQLLLAKVAVVALIMAMAGYNRYVLVPRLSLLGSDHKIGSERESLGRPPWVALRRALRLEAVGIIVVLALTAVLANTTPSSSLLPQPVRFSETRSLGDRQVAFDITPNRAGSNQLTVRFTDAAGTPNDTIQGVSVSYNLPDKGVGPISRNLTKSGPGTYGLTDPEDLSIPGTWKVTLQIRTGEFDQQDFDYTDTVR